MSNNIQQKDMQYKFWGGISLFSVGGVVTAATQITGTYEKFIPIGIEPATFTVPVWFMIIGGVMLVGITAIKMWKNYRAK